MLKICVLVILIVFPVDVYGEPIRAWEYRKKLLYKRIFSVYSILIRHVISKRKMDT